MKPIYIFLSVMIAASLSAFGDKPADAIGIFAGIAMVFYFGVDTGKFVAREDDGMQERVRSGTADLPSSEDLDKAGKLVMEGRSTAHFTKFAEMGDTSNYVKSLLITAFGGKLPDPENYTREHKAFMWALIRMMAIMIYAERIRVAREGKTP